MKTIITLLLAGLLAGISYPPAAGAEFYYIEDNRVLLYKIINWWYDALPEEAEQLCGDVIRHHNQGKIHSSYNAGQKTLVLHLPGGFANLLSAAEHGIAVSRPSVYACSQLSRKHFGNGTSSVTIEEFPITNSYTFRFQPVNTGQYRKILSMLDTLQVILEGTIGGLQNGKIALYTSNRNLYDCTSNSLSAPAYPPPSLKIVKPDTQELLAEYCLMPKQ